MYPVDPNAPRSGLSVWKNYSCTLNQTDIAANSNKFYIIQCLTDGKNSYFLLTRYGRVGEKGRVDLKVVSSVSDAEGAFESTYKTKTGNVWGAKFVPKSGKYVQLEIEAPEIVEVKVAPPTLSTLPDKLQTFISLISNKQLFERALETMEIDTQRLPLGKMSSAQIDQGEAILKLIETAVKDGTGDLVGLSSQFWTVIPFATKRNRPPPVINSSEAVVKVADMLDSLRHISVAGTIIERRNNLDDIYKSLSAEVIPVQPNSTEWGQVMTYITNTHAPTHRYRLNMVNLFKVNKPGQDTMDTGNVFTTTKNHKLLFHGSRMTNFVGILSEGLRLPRPDQVANGAMLSAGIYMADSISKSYNYTFADETNRKGFVIIAEVALGEVENVYQATPGRLPAQYQSRSGRGKSTPDPLGTQKWSVNPDVEIPSGRLVQTNVGNTSLLYNEYVIFSKECYRFRYIVELDSY